MYEKLINAYSSDSSSDYSEASSHVRFERACHYACNLHNTDIKELSILDFGCGPGNFVKWLQTNNRRFKQYYGSDIRLQTLDLAKKLYQTSDVFFTNDIYTQKYDIIFCLGTLSYAYDSKCICLHNFANELKKLYLLTNSMIITFPKKEHVSKNDDKLIKLTYNEVCAFMKDIFVLDFYVDVNSLINEYIVYF